MIFQTLDDKDQCVGIYANNKLHFDDSEFPDNLSVTWQYVPYLRDLDVDYALLYLEGTPLKQVLPEYLKDDWEDVSRSVASFRRSLAAAKVDMGENCFFDLVPKRFLINLCEVKNNITEYIIKNIDKPKRYDFNKHVSMMLGDIANRKVNINKRVLKSLLSDKKNKNRARLLEASPHVCYNQFGSRTGRLTTKPNTFPILTMSKSLRTIVEPTNDFFVELDFNGAEVRTLLGLLNKEQPTGDVHNFHLREVFKTLKTREEAKVAFFAWMYGSTKSTSAQESTRLAEFYEKKKLLDTYLFDKTIVTPYGKKIEDVSEHHALNYIIQSTAAELTLKQALKMEYLLRNKSSGSFISFLVHDAIVLDMKKEDTHLLKSLVFLMGSTNFGEFKINIKRGSNLGHLKEYSFG